MIRFYYYYGTVKHNGSRDICKLFLQTTQRRARTISQHSLIMVIADAVDEYMRLGPFEAGPPTMTVFQRYPNLTNRQLQEQLYSVARAIITIMSRLI